MARSSIACARCRRSKVKCVNTGVDSVCKACEISGRECTYPPSGASVTPKRPEPTGGVKLEDTENKKRVKKADDFTRRNSHRTGEDVLDSPILCKRVWDEVYDVFKRNFSTEMPFLHHPTFQNRLRQVAIPRDPSISAPADAEGEKLLLLGVLTLTARFQPDLIAHHSPNDPLGASEFYAAVLVNSCGLSGNNLATPCLERVQALLMLGLYEWVQSKGGRAWFHVGAAIRLAQMMGLSYEDDVDSFTPALDGRPVNDSDTDKEIRRRTMWSCFVMDRMLSAGKNRARMIDSHSLKLRLPCPDDEFLFVRSALSQTGFLSDPVSTNDGGLVNRYVRLVDIWGHLSVWSYGGGRRSEKHPPWDEKSTFFHFRQELNQFRRDLPEHLAFSLDNVPAHAERRVVNTYTFLHTLHLLCLIMLHREYVPYLPLRCTKPDGPLDEPTFPKDRYNIPPGFWEDSADILFRSGKDVIELVQACKENNVLPESAQIVFVLFVAAFTGTYSVLFPYMDPAGHMRRSDQEMANGHIGYSSLAIKLLKEMAPRSQMAAGYIRKLKLRHKTYQDYKTTYLRKRTLPFVGGGLEEYKSLEKELKDFGTLEDVNGGYEDSVNRSRASTNDIGGVGMNGDGIQSSEGVPQPRSNGTWAAVNTVSNSIEVDDRQKFGPQGAGGSQYGFQGSQRSSSNTPSHINSSNGDSMAALNSPYGRPDHQRPGDSRQALPLIPQPMSMGPPSVHVGVAPWGPGETVSDGAFNTWLLSVEDTSAWNAAKMDDFQQGYTEPPFAIDYINDQQRATAAAWGN